MVADQRHLFKIQRVKRIAFQQVIDKANADAQTKLNCSLEQPRNVDSLALFGKSMMQGKLNQVTGTLHLFYKQLLPSHQMLFT